MTPVLYSRRRLRISPQQCEPRTARRHFHNSDVSNDVAASETPPSYNSIRLSEKLGEVEACPQNSAKNASNPILAGPAITTRRANVRKLLAPIRSPPPPARHQRTKRKKRMRVEGGNSHSQTEFSKRCLSFKFLDQLLLTGDYTNYSEMCRRSRERNGDVYAHNGPYRRFLPAFRDVRKIVRQLRRA